VPPELTAGAPPEPVPLLELGGVDDWSVGGAAELELSVGGAVGAAAAVVVVVGAAVVVGATVVVVEGTVVDVVLSGGIEWSFGPASFFIDS
jgi:hypothetical protein